MDFDKTMPLRPPKPAASKEQQKDEPTIALTKEQSAASAQPAPVAKEQPKAPATKESPQPQSAPVAKEQPAQPKPQPVAKEQPKAPPAKESSKPAAPAPVAKEQPRTVENFEPETAADAWLGLLASRGVEYLFANGGTDFAPVVEAYKLTNL